MIKSDDPDWKEKVEALSLEPEAVALRQALERALQAYWEWFSSRGVMPGIRVSVGENMGPKQKMN